MDLNDQAKVTLTEYGASVLNAENEMWKKKFPNAFSTVKTDYKKGDVYESQLWVILDRFSDCYQAGHKLPFTDLEKVNQPTWIKTSEKLPTPVIEVVDGEKYGSVFVIGQKKEWSMPHMCCYFGYNGNYRWEDSRVPDYWMQIPEFNKE